MLFPESPSWALPQKWGQTQHLCFVEKRALNKYTQWAGNSSLRTRATEGDFSSALRHRWAVSLSKWWFVLECQKLQNWKPQTFICSFQLHKSEPAKNLAYISSIPDNSFPVLWMVWLAAALAAIRDDQLFLTVVALGCSLPPPGPGTAVLQLYLPACCCSGSAPSGWACFAEQHWELPQCQLWVHNTPACKKKRSPGKKTTLLTQPAGVC